MYKYLAIILSLLLMSCSESGGGSAQTEPDAVTTSVVILNNMTPTGLDADGVAMDAVFGDNSIGDTNELFRFDPAIPYGESGVLTLTAEQCNIFWDFTPFSYDGPFSGLPSTSVFFPCDQTLSCVAVIIDAYGSKQTRLYDCE